MDLELRGTVAVITGGASGIGRACAEAFAAEGAKVAIFDRAAQGEAAAGALRASGAEAVFVDADLTDERAVRSAVADVAGRWGTIDTLVGSAGISGPVGTPLADTDVAEWDAVMSVNVRGNFLVAKHAIPYMQSSPVGTVILVASDAAFAAFEGMGVYSASKAAVAMLAKAIAVDHPAIRANAICPGIVDTPMSRRDLGRERTGFDGSGLPVMPAARLAQHILFLASPVSAPINATTIVSDFGYLARSAVGTLDFS